MNNTVDTTICRMEAEWEPATGMHQVYRMQIAPDARMVEHLGAVKKRTDSRWDWWRWASDFHIWAGPAQGVVETMEEAKAQVISGWPDRLPSA